METFRAPVRSDNRAAGAPSHAPKQRWIPIRTLAARHRSRILYHLLGLDERDRYLRFGQVASDEQITHYVESIDFERDEVFGVFDRRLRLVAVAHLAFASGAEGGAARCAEFGVSVAPHLRGRGCGERLFERAALHARNRGVDTLLVHALSENAAMLRIARKAGARVERDGAESRALVKLAAETFGTHVEALVEEQAAGLDYALKRHGQRLDHLLSALTQGG